MASRLLPLEVSLVKTAVVVVPSIDPTALSPVSFIPEDAFSNLEVEGGGVAFLAPSLQEWGPFVIISKRRNSAGLSTSARFPLPALLETCFRILGFIEEEDDGEAAAFMESMSTSAAAAAQLDELKDHSPCLSTHS